MIPARCGTILIMLLTTYSGYSQIKVSGTFLDSAKSNPVPFVQIYTSKKSVGVADENGFFFISCFPGDTIHFSRVGYKSTTRIATTNESGLIISLAEQSFQLEPVTIFGNYIPQGHNKWFDYIMLPKPYQNSNAYQTFGIGVRIPGPISYFTKFERERRNLKKLKSHLAATAVYRPTIASEELKDHFMQLFKLSEDEYYYRIEKFNVEYPDAQYLKEKKEIIDLLTYFFARKEK